MHKDSEAKLSFTFGDIGIKASVDGNVDRPAQVVDHVLTTAISVVGIEALQYGLSDYPRDEGKFDQPCKSTTQFGEITVNIELQFDLKRDISKRTINSMVFDGILPKVWQTIGLYLGSNQQLTNPPAPLPQRSRQDVLVSIDEVLSLTPPRSQFAAEVYGPQHSEQQRQRQATLR
jgi:hypothetical protein